MALKKSERLIVKYLTNQATQEEMNLLTQWLDKDGSKEIFAQFVKANYAADILLSEYDSSKVKKKLTEIIRKEDKTFYQRNYTSFYQYAAILLVVLGSFYFYKSDILSVSKENVIIPKENEIVLQIGNEASEIIDPSKTRDITDKFGKTIGKINNKRLVYSDANLEGPVTYNTLKIPYGKRFDVQLSDGTIVYLNSGSSLRYPVQFSKNKSRQVFLVGEAYFEVAKDKQHPFTVNTQDINVQVLGTRFNVSSYTEDISTDVVLVEGKVSLYKDIITPVNQVFLNPGLKGSCTRGGQKITVNSVNTRYYTAWLNGDLVFKNASFEEIIKKLERNYSVTIVNNNKKLANEVFNANFDNKSIEDILKYFSESYALRYVIKEDKITIQ
ncbi:FecR family protein [Flavobacterium sp. FlaQc-47]|uniref:FecR family protein n=1 Tax=Flavobacterium sp. FlaQc-47 TaxID=3374180 RepID=UPI0037567BD2